MCANYVSLEEAKNEFWKVKRSIDSLLSKLGDNCENVRVDELDLEEDFMLGQFKHLEDKLDDVSRMLKYLSKPIEEQGLLRHNESGRYTFPSGDYLTSGSTCEVLLTPKGRSQYWVYTSIEHNGEDYYATTLGRNSSLNGIMARKRSRY